MHANNREDVKAAFAGDIIAIGGLKARGWAGDVLLVSRTPGRGTLLPYTADSLARPQRSRHHPVSPPTPHAHANFWQDCITGETLCDEKAPIVLERMDFPDPVIKIAIEPKAKADLEKMVRGAAFFQFGGVPGSSPAG